MVVSIQGSRIIRHLSLQITKLIHLSPGPAFPQNGAKNGHVFELIGTNDSVVDILSAACSDADDEVYRLVQQLYHLTLDTSDWRCEAVRSVYSGVEPHIYHVAANWLQMTPPLVKLSLVHLRGIQRQCVAARTIWSWLPRPLLTIQLDCLSCRPTHLPFSRLTPTKQQQQH